MSEAYPDSLEGAAFAPLNRSILGGILSTEYGDCSIAASAMAKLSRDTLAKRARDGYVYEVGSNAPKPLDVAWSSSKHDKFAYSALGFNARIGIAQDVRMEPIISEASIEDGSQRRGLLSIISGRQDETTQEKEREPSFRRLSEGDPFLLLSFGGNASIVIATFALRTDGNCSYVQLGAEMEDDNFHVTVADDKTSRFDIIEGLRMDFDNDLRKNAGELNSEKRHQAVQEFIDGQLQVRESKVIAILESAIARGLQSQFEKSSDDETITILDEEHAPRTENMRTVDLIPDYFLPDGRKIRLIFARGSNIDGTEPDAADLLAVTQANVAIKLGSVSRNFQSVELIESIESNQKNRAIALNCIFQAMSDEDISLASAIELGSWQSNKGGYLERGDYIEAEDYFAALCLYNSLNGHQTKRATYRKMDLSRGTDINKLTENKRSNRLRVGSRNVASTKIKIMTTKPKFLVSPFEFGREYGGEGSAVINSYLDAQELMQENFQGIMDLFDVQQKLESALGIFNIEDAYCLDRVEAMNKLGPGPKSIWIQNLGIGKTTDDAEIEAIVEAKDGVFDLQLRGRPASMPTAEMSNIVSIRIIPYSKNRYMINGRVMDIPEADKVEISNYLNLIVTNYL